MRLCHFLCTSLIAASTALPAEKPQEDFILPDLGFVKSLISRQFYIENLDFDRKVASISDLIELLHARRLDPWSTIVKQSTAVGDIAIRRNGFGLRVLKFNEHLYYLLPELDSPNERKEFTIYQTLNSPTNGDWSSSMESGAIQLLDANVTFKQGDFLTHGIRIDSWQVRVDNFINPSMPSIFNDRGGEFSNVTLVDLRFNSGGRVDLAAEFARLLVGIDIPLGSIERRGEYTLIGGTIPLDTAAKAQVIERSKSMVILVSRFTASSAEWLARNLQIYGATLIGERSAGKCLAHKSFAIGAGYNLQLAVGKLYVANQTKKKQMALYDYCEFGLIPDRWIDGRLLVSQPASWLAESVLK